jgi:hypothetical protein
VASAKRDELIMQYHATFLEMNLRLSQLGSLVVETGISSYFSDLALTRFDEVSPCPLSGLIARQITHIVSLGLKSR